MHTHRLELQILCAAMVAAVSLAMITSFRFNLLMKLLMKISWPFLTVMNTLVMQDSSYGYYCKSSVASLAQVGFSLLTQPLAYVTDVLHH